MRRIFEFVGGFALIAFSFYFTDRVSLLVQNKSELMQEIKAVSSIYEETPVDAVINIEDNTITPGKYGKVVDMEESYLQMHDFGSFNENYLVYEYIKPNKSLEDNKDKFVTSGNKTSRKVGFIVMDNEEVMEYFNSKSIPYDMVLKSYESTRDSVEVINGGVEKKEFNAINSKVGNVKLCLKDVSNMELCKKNSYYLIDPKLTLNSTNFIDIKNNIEPGSITLITSSAKLEEVKLVLNEIEYKDLEIVNIYKLISEKESA